VAAPAAAARAPGRLGRLPLFLTLLVIVALVGWYVDHTTQTRATSPAYSSPSSNEVVRASQPPQPQLHTLNIGQGALSVAAMHYNFYTLPVPEGARSVKVQGHFQATGGSNNDIEVFLLNDEQFTNWKNRHAAPTYYNSGKITVGDVQAALPDGVGTYYLVFNNNFSLLTAKAVMFTGTMVYYQ
jgi:hypothetical protein